MSTRKNDEFRVLATQLRDRYRKVKSKVDQVCGGDQISPTTEELEEINQLLADVKETEAKLKPIRDSLEADGQNVPDDMKPIIDETIGIVMGLIPQISELEQAAVKSRNKLSPHIKASVRAIQMRSAYSRGR